MTMRVHGESFEGVGNLLSLDESVQGLNLYMNDFVLLL